jgi:hypothetical protein
MHGFLSKFAMVLALAGTSVVTGCGNNNSGMPDGGSGGAGPTDGAVIDTGYVGCVDGGPTACPTPPVTYAKVEPIFQARCVNVCHNDMTLDPNDPTMMAKIWGFTDYEHVVAWQDTIRADMISCAMPPPDAGVPLTVEERWAILEFIRCGLPK